ncbi:MAG TPA: hypothetical protein PKA00_17070 [Saprospiraceae bacterium]|nr:hypothetical protein [Saprospiraceae bacterium]HMQ84631.1 hypothetical protein [Saprospiraceae bacterium]
MKNVTTLLLSTFLVFGMMCTVSAQEIFSAEEKVQVIQNVDEYIYNLNLSERDKPEFRFIIEDFFIGLSALRETEFSMDAKKKIVRTLAKDRDKRVKEVLSSDQYKVYKARIKEQRGKLVEFMKKQS